MARLKVNETKSAVASMFGRKFLGLSLWVAPGGVVKRKVAAKPLLALRYRIRELTRRSCERSMNEAVETTMVLCGWLQGVLPAGANGARLVGTGQVAASPVAGHSV